MPATTGVRVKGLRELNRAFARMSREVKKDLRDELKAAGEPVRARAENMALTEIANVTPNWGRMKVGVTSRVVYVAPSARRAGGSPRPNFGGLLMRKAMEPALEKERAEVVRSLEKMLGRLGDRNGF